MIWLLLWAFWFFAPAGAANIAPMLAARVPLLHGFTTPLDLGKTYRGKRILGDNKTIRGLVAGAVFGAVVGALQWGLAMLLNLNFLQGQAGNYHSPATIWLGALLGFGALVGDALESFFKRQAGIAPGGSWFPFDQIDYVLGGCLAAELTVRLSLAEFAAVLVVWFVMHIIFSYLGYRMSWKKTPV